MNFYAVTGRIPGDDDDTLMSVGQHASRDEAIAAFVAQMLADNDMDEMSDEEIAEFEKAHGSRVFVNQVMQSSAPIVDAENNPENRRDLTDDSDLGVATVKTEVLRNHGHPWDARKGFDVLLLDVNSQAELDAAVAAAAEKFWQPWVVGAREGGTLGGAFYKPCGANAPWEDSAEQPHPGGVEHVLQGDKDARATGLNEPTTQAGAAPGAFAAAQKMDSKSTVPFMTVVEGKVHINDGETGAPLAGDWTGVCCDGGDAKSYWYIGRSLGERSFNKLTSRDFEGATQEVARLNLAFSPASEQALALHSFVEMVAAMNIWSYDQDSGEPYKECEEPADGFLDSHCALMNLIEDARRLPLPQRELVKPLTQMEGDLFALRRFNRELMGGTEFGNAVAEALVTIARTHGVQALADIVQLQAVIGQGRGATLNVQTADSRVLDVLRALPSGGQQWIDSYTNEISPDGSVIRRGGSDGMAGSMFAQQPERNTPLATTQADLEAFRYARSRSRVADEIREGFAKNSTSSAQADGPSV